MKALLEPDNIVCQIVADSNTFPVHSSLKWVDAPDGVTEGFSYDEDTGKFTDEMKAQAATPKGLRGAMVHTRLEAYGPIGDQLDMLYNDMKNGTTTWVDRIDAAKAATPSVTDPFTTDPTDI